MGMWHCGSELWVPHPWRCPRPWMGPGQLSWGEGTQPTAQNQMDFEPNRAVILF